MKVLETERLLLRPLETTDVFRLARITNDPLVTRNLMRTTHPFSASDARSLILRAKSGDKPVWAIDDVNWLE